MRLLITALVWGLRLYLVRFFLFVGYWKAFGEMSLLAQYKAWVSGLPDLLARAVGWQEILCALLLLVPAFPRVRHVAPVAALLLLINQIVALAVHIHRGEAGEAAPQNVMLIVMLAIAAIGAAKLGDSRS